MLVYRQQKAVSGRRPGTVWPALPRAGTDQTLGNCQINECRVVLVTAQKSGKTSMLCTPRVMEEEELQVCERGLYRGGFG